MKRLLPRVFVSGTGVTAFGELWRESVESMAARAAREAMEEAKITHKEVDLLIVGNMLVQQLEQRAQVGSIVAQAIAFAGPTLHIEGACASGGLAVRQGVMAIRSGMARRVLIVGVEKMSDVGSDDIARALMAAGDEEEQWAGATFPALYAMMMREYMAEYDIHEADVAAVAVQSHKHACLNPLAQFRREISVAEVLSSELVADPIRQLMCAPFSDGAAALVLEAGRAGVEIVGSGQGGDVLGLSGRNSLFSMKATQTACEAAFKESGLRVLDIDVAEVHDCFSIAQLMAVRDLGLVDRTVINTSGGLKACGHPVGATGVKQVVEVARQLLGVCVGRQVHNARVGLTQNVGGTGATAVVHILRRLHAD